MRSSSEGLSNDCGTLQNFGVDSLGYLKFSVYFSSVRLFGKHRRHCQTLSMDRNILENIYKLCSGQSNFYI